MKPSNRRTLPFVGNVVSPVKTTISALVINFPATLFFFFSLLRMKGKLTNRARIARGREFFARDFPHDGCVQFRSFATRLGDKVLLRESSGINNVT